MSETIAMTPPDRNGNQVFWQKTQSENGTLYLASDCTPGKTGLLWEGSKAKPNLQLVGQGKRKDIRAKVYRRGGSAIRSVPYMNNTHAGLDWLKANLMLWDALRTAPTIEEFPNGVKTPEYFGVLVTDKRLVTIMSYEGGGREHIERPTIEEQTKLDAAHRHCRDAVYERYGCFLGIDQNTDNILLGDSDAVKLDIQMSI